MIDNDMKALSRSFRVYAYKECVIKVEFYSDIQQVSEYVPEKREVPH